VITVLREALLALGEAGHPVAANRLAARAWSSLRAAHPTHAETINRTMHVLARMEAAQGSHQPPPTSHPPITNKEQP